MPSSSVVKCLKSDHDLLAMSDLSQLEPTAATERHTEILLLAPADTSRPSRELSD
jgi:hypothetical protein